MGRYCGGRGMDRVRGWFRDDGGGERVSGIVRGMVQESCRGHWGIVGQQ